MKRIISILTIITLVGFLFSCEKEDDINKLRVTTMEAIQSSYLSVELHGSVNGPSSIIDNSEIGIEYSTDESFSFIHTERLRLDNTENHNDYSFIASIIKQNETYYFRAYCAYRGTFYYGEVKAFSFNWDGPIITTQSAVFDNGSYELSGTIEDLGTTLRNLNEDIDSLSYGFECSINSLFEKDSTTYLIPDVYYSFLGDSVLWYFSDFIYGKKYYYRTFFKFNDEFYYGETKTFTTPIIEMTTGVIDTSLYITTCHLNNVNIGSRNVLYGVCYNYTGKPTIQDSTITVYTVDKDYSYTIAFPHQDIAVGVDVYYRAFVMINGIPYYGGVKSFKREAKLNGYDFVDLGLSVLWATVNLGATKPEEYGDYYAWAEIEPKASYSWNTYKYCDGYSGSMNKYSNGTMFNPMFTDNKYEIEPSDDAAHMNWGGDWRLPTRTEYDELLDEGNCSWVWMTINGINGYKVTSYNGNSIFLPATGYKESAPAYVETGATYWTSTLFEGNPNYAYHMEFYSDRRQTTYYNRSIGRAIRPVCPRINATETDDYSYVDLGLSVKWATRNLGAKRIIDSGDYYAWGETTTKEEYTLATYKYCNGTRNSFTKYCDEPSFGYNNEVDNKTTLDSEDDVATLLLGEDWHIPSATDFYELYQNCTSKWISSKGVWGYKMISNIPGYEGMFIFLPAAGTKESYPSTTAYGCYWSSSLGWDFPNDKTMPSTARALDFGEHYTPFVTSPERYNGLPIRPVHK